MIEKGLANFNIVTIQLEPDKNPWEKPQEIFESMNSLGKPLSLADLVRNYLLLGKTSAKQDDLYHNYWLKIELNLYGDNSSFTVSAFIRDYMQVVDVSNYKKATETNYKELYRDFKNLFEDDNHENLVKSLADYSNNYAILAGYKSSGNPKIDQKISDLKILESSGFYSFILGLLRLRTEEKINDDDVWQILDAIFIYISRRRILRITQAENKNAPLLVKYFDDLISSKDKKTKMFELLANQLYALRMPNDIEISAYLTSAESNFYNLRVGKFLQCLIEEKITKTRPNLSEKSLQVEHIMPQTLNQAWKDELGKNYQEIHNNYLNNIGNLTLIRHNSELNNRPFADKKRIYKNNAGMQIAKDKIVDQSKWSEKQIKARAEYLINILLDKILPLPESLRTSNNYSLEKRKSGSRKLSFINLDLIGKEITYWDDASIIAEVIGDKEVKFEGKIWKLSPLTREIETRKNRRNKSGAYWGAPMWLYQGKNLETWTSELSDNIEDDQDDE